jgi:voltage-gated potassium channel
VTQLLAPHSRDTRAVDDRLSLRRFGLATIALLVVLLAGLLGFHWILGEDYVSAFYRVVVTVSLTGLDTKPAGHAAEIFTVAVLLAGVAIFLYVADAIVEMIARGVFTGARQERRKRKLIEKLRDHHVICGYGRVGRRVAREFREAGVPYVVVDFSEVALEAARERGDLFIEGRGTDDVNLREAGLEHARGLVASSDSDVDNLYITLSARTLRPDLLIVARASTEDAAEKLLRAGANRVVQPYDTAGQEMAKLVLKPQVAVFLELLSSRGGPDLRFEEIEVSASCGQVGRTIRDLRVRAETGALIVGLRRRDGGYDTTPSPDTRLEDGDVLIVVGTEEELRAVEDLFAPQQAVAR